MKSELDWVRNRFLQAMRQYDLQPEPRPEAFCRQEKLVRGAPLVVTSEGGFEAAHRFSYKYTRVQSALVDIATVVVYPVSDVQGIPVFVLELVVVGERVHVAVIDVEPLDGFAGDAALEMALRPLQQRFTAQVPNDPDLPDWFRDICSPVHLFGNAPIEKLAVYEEAFCDYLAIYLQEFVGPSSATLPAVEAAAVGAYKRHHYEHSPAKKVMSRFEDDWFETFMRDYHFGPAYFCSQSLSLRLRRETRSQHRATEGTRLLGFYRRPPGDYTDYRKVLLGFHHVHSVLEPGIRGVLESAGVPLHRDVGALALDARSRVALLERDLAALGTDARRWLPSMRGSLPPVPKVSSCEDAVGFLYVLEGSTLGATVVTSALRKHGWCEGAIHYYRGYGTQTRPMWESFRTVIDRMPVDHDPVIAAARLLFAYFGELFVALESLQLAADTAAAAS